HRWALSFRGPMNCNHGYVVLSYAFIDYSDEFLNQLYRCQFALNSVLNYLGAASLPFVQQLNCICEKPCGCSWQILVNDSVLLVCKRSSLTVPRWIQRNEGRITTLIQLQVRRSVTPSFVIVVRVRRSKLQVIYWSHVRSIAISGTVKGVQLKLLFLLY